MKKLTVFLTALLLSVPLTGCSFSALTADSEPVESEAVAETQDNSTTEESSIGEEEDLSAAFGTWEFEEEDEDGFHSAIVIKGKNEAYVRTSDYEEGLYFDGNRDLWINKGKFSKDKYEKNKYVFEDGILTVTYNKKYVIVMEKTDDSEDVYGEYDITGGQYYDMWQEEFGNDIKQLKADMSADQTILTLYRIDQGFELTKDHFRKHYDGKVYEGANYTIEGDTMILINESGEERKMIRMEE